MISKEPLFHELCFQTGIMAWAQQASQEALFIEIVVCMVPPGPGRAVGAKTTQPVFNQKVIISV